MLSFRFGLCPAIASIHTIQGGEEIFVRYGYDLGKQSNKLIDTPHLPIYFIHLLPIT